MSRVHDRTGRAVTTLLGVLFVALTAGLFCGPASAAEAGRAPGAPVSDAFESVQVSALDQVSGSGQVSSARQVSPAAVVDDGVGCGKSKRHDRDAQQSNPSRGNPAGELFTAFAHAHAAADLCAPSAPAPAPAQDRAPPPVHPPTPVNLSVLRV